MLDSDGLPPRESLKQFLGAVGDRDLFSDDPEFDSHWLSMLVDAAISFGGRKLRDAKKLVEQVSVNHRLEFADPPRHRAEADARRLAFAVTQATLITAKANSKYQMALIRRPNAAGLPATAAGSDLP
jgi:hypothetical protein